MSQDNVELLRAGYSAAEPFTGRNALGKRGVGHRRCGMLVRFNDLDRSEALEAVGLGE